MGDYDVDGVVSTTIMIDFFNLINIEVNFIIPNRFKHGYGLSVKIVDMITSGLVITVDNGIGACEAVSLLNNKNIDVIITDHHTVSNKIPNAYAIINPKQEDCKFVVKNICGAQVAWYLCVALKQELQVDIDMASFFDLLCLAIIADIMPITDLNYLMVKYGLKKIKSSQRPAFKKLNEKMKKNIFISDDIAFFIAPLINSAGRIDDAKLALSFLLSKDEYEASHNLSVLEELNSYRKTIQESILQKAYIKTRKQDKAIVVWGEDWHEGVIGIVAAKLLHKYKKPAFVFSISNGIAKGSARANANINLYSIIKQTSKLLLGFGGHKNAAGLSLDEKNLEEFKTQINTQLEEELQLYIEPKVLGEIDVSCVDLEFIEIIQRFEPYGLDNIKPIFFIKKAKILKVELFGKDKNHLKLTLNSNGFIYEALKFYSTQNIDDHYIDLIVNVTKNEFMGKISIQFLIQDIL